MIAGPLDEIRRQLDEAVSKPGLTPGDRVTKLRFLREEIESLAGRADTYLADQELVREAETATQQKIVREAYEDAELREEMIRRGIATAGELDQLGIVSRVELDQLDEEGRLIEALGTLRSWTERLHPRGRGGKFRRSFHEPTVKGPEQPAPPPKPSASKKPAVAKAEQKVERAVPTPEAPKQPEVTKAVTSKKPSESVTKKPKPDVVTHDPEEALKALADGKTVELHTPEELSTLLDKLHAVVQDMETKGEKAPNFDLCKVTVKGTSIFCVESKGIPRVQMPQLLGVPQEGTKADALPRSSRGEVDLADEFKDYLKAKGTNIERKQISASHLKATQNELNGVKVAGIMSYLKGGGKIESPPYLVGQGGYIVDGHHRWAAEVGMDFEDGVPDWDVTIDNIDLPILDLLKEANDFANEWGIPQAGFGAGFGTQQEKKVAETTHTLFLKDAFGIHFDQEETALVEAVLAEDEFEHDDESIEEAFGRYTELLHPRDRWGRWMDKLSRFDHAKREYETGVTAALLHMLHPSERTLSDKASHATAADEVSVYAQAEKHRDSFHAVLDFGVGIARTLQADASYVTSGEAWDNAKKEIGKNRNKPHVIVADVKSRKRAKEKADGEYSGDWTKLTDVLRGSVLVPHPVDVPVAADALRENAIKEGWKVSAVKQRMIRIEGDRNAPGPQQGYRDVLWLLEKDGFQAEVQINTTDMWVAKEVQKGHRLYEQKRVIWDRAQEAERDLTPEEFATIARLSKESTIHYQAAWRRSLKQPTGTLRAQRELH